MRTVTSLLVSSVSLWIGSKYPFIFAAEVLSSRTCKVTTHRVFNFLATHIMLGLCPQWPLMRTHITMRHSLATAQASGMHVALERLPAASPAAARHHAANAVTATGPRPCPRARTTPAVTGPRWGPSSTLPTLIRPTGTNGAVASTKEHGQTTKRVQRREEKDGQTHRAERSIISQLVKPATSVNDLYKCLDDTKTI